MLLITIMHRSDPLRLTSTLQILYKKSFCYSHGFDWHKIGIWLREKFRGCCALDCFFQTSGHLIRQVCSSLVGHNVTIWVDKLFVSKLFSYTDVRCEGNKSNESYYSEHLSQCFLLWSLHVWWKIIRNTFLNLNTNFCFAWKTLCHYNCDEFLPVLSPLDYWCDRRII